MQIPVFSSPEFKALPGWMRVMFYVATALSAAIGLVICWALVRLFVFLVVVL